MNQGIVKNELGRVEKAYQELGKQMAVTIFSHLRHF
jgi:hypothetical protein